MPELLTTEEAATYLRLSERKLYELVANGAVPCTKVTGKWLFPKAALDRWLAAGLVGPSALAQAPAPPIVGGSHDPLLEWALRESGSQLASLPEGSEAGLTRLARGEVTAAAIHLHRLDGDDELRERRRHRGCAWAARRGADRVRAARAGAGGGARQSARARRHRRRRVAPRPARVAAAGRRRATPAARAAGARRPHARCARHRQTGVSDRPRHRPGRALRPRRLRHRHPLGGAGGRSGLRAAHLGALRPGAAPARLFRARRRRCCSSSCAPRSFASAPRNWAATTWPRPATCGT